MHDPPVVEMGDGGLVPAERAMLRKERQARSYRLSAYVAAKTLSEMPILCVLPLLNITVIYMMVGFPYEYAAPPCGCLRPFLDTVTHLASSSVLPRQCGGVCTVRADHLSDIADVAVGGLVHRRHRSGLPTRSVDGCVFT
jgi:hypothetical protein